MADFNVQRGETTIAGSNTTATITAGTDYTAPASTTKAFIRIVASGPHSGGGNEGGFSGNPDHWAVWINNPTNLLTSITFERGAANVNALELQWEIIEYTGSASGTNEIVVRHVEALSDTNNATVDSTTVSGVVTDADVAVFITGSGTNFDGHSRAEVNEIANTAEWVGGATDVARLTFDGVGDPTDTRHISIAVVEFTGSNWTVQRVTQALTTDDTNETVSITTVADVNKTFIHSQFRTTANTIPQSPESWVSSTTQITSIIYAGASACNLVHWVIENSGNMNVQRISGSRADQASANDSFTESITAVPVLAEASIMGESSAQDSGTAPSDCDIVVLGFRMTAADTVTITNEYSNRALSYHFEVVEWPSEQGRVWVNDASSWDSGAVLQTYPGAANWSDTQIDMQNVIDAEGLTPPLYLLVETATGAVASRAITEGYITSVSGDDTVPPTETDWVIVGNAFGDD